MKILNIFLSGFEQILPDYPLIFNVFKLIRPENVRCVLYGEDPYPRVTSACGVAFWDTGNRSMDTKNTGKFSKKYIEGVIGGKRLGRL